MSEATPPDRPEKSVLKKEDAQEALRYLSGMLDWYWQQADKWEWWALRLQFLILILSSLVTVVAAIPLALDPPDHHSWVKLTVVALSALTTLVSGLLSKSGIERTAQLREQGRVRLVTLKEKAMLRLTSEKMTEEERRKYLEQLIDETKDVEEKFGVHPLVASKRPPPHDTQGAS
jgi:hypothetical protein